MTMPGLAQRRLIRKGVMSLAIVALLAIFLVMNLPGESRLRQRFGPVERTMHSLGLSQGWGVFIHPRLLESLYLEADVYLSDGSIETYRSREFGRIVGAYRAARWHKLEEHALLAESYGAPEASRIFSEWLARRYDGVERVVLYKLSTRTTLPGGQTEQVRSRVYELSL